MSNKLIIAAAGSGKTTHLVKESLMICDQKILITTYTEVNKKEIINKFFELNNCIPDNITIQTWFSFLIQHGVKPYQSVVCEGNIKGVLLVNQKSGFRYNGSNNRPVYWGESDPKNHYFSNTQRIYSDKLSKFVVKANELTDGLVIKRIGKIYQYIFIDEVQDLAGYDLEILKLMFTINSNILLVGDPRQVTYHTHWETKYKKYLDGKIIDFIKKECSTHSVEIDDTSLNKTYRNNKEICCFANSIYKNFKPCEYEGKESTEHDGVFFIPTSDVDNYLSKFNPMQLRDSRKVKVNINYPVMNFGESKGLTFERILIYPTNKMIEWIFNRETELTNQSRSKFYVAVTRAKFSVAIVYDNIKKFLPEGIRDYNM